MIREPLPNDVRKAIEWLEAEPARPWRLGDLAAACGVAPRTLQKHFRRFVGHAPLVFLRELRFGRARQELLRASHTASVTEIATRLGFGHLGRFATEYHRRYGESPSATLRRSRRASAPPLTSLQAVASRLERPTIAILPFDSIGSQRGRATAFAEEIAMTVLHLHWINVAATPTHARYHLGGKVHENGRDCVRVTVKLLDALTGRYLWAGGWDGDRRDPIGFEERVAIGVARAVQPALRIAEVERASRRERGALTAWELSMRALPKVTLIEAESEGMALEYLNQAMELAPHDPLPVAMAAWCHGLRAGHHFTVKPETERAVARKLAGQAARLCAADALAETMLAAGYTLAHDLGAAAIHAERALALDGGSAWAWGRSGWVKAYRGCASQAIEEFQIARSLAPTDSLSFLWSVGIASAAFQKAHYENSVHWYKRALAENPASTWIKRFLAPAYVLAGRMNEGRRTLREFTTVYPGVTIADVRSGLPWNAQYLDRVSEGLESAGMRP